MPATLLYCEAVKACRDLSCPFIRLNSHAPAFPLSNAVRWYPLSLILARRVCDLSRLPLHDR
jgi:hypothetical protein